MTFIQLPVMLPVPVPAPWVQAQGGSSCAPSCACRGKCPVLAGNHWAPHVHDTLRVKASATVLAGAALKFRGNGGVGRGVTSHRLLRQFAHARFLQPIARCLASVKEPWQGACTRHDTLPGQHQHSPFNHDQQGRDTVALTADHQVTAATTTAVAGRLVPQPCACRQHTSRKAVKQLRLTGNNSQ